MQSYLKYLAEQYERKQKQHENQYFYDPAGNAAMARQDRDPASDPEQEAWVAGQR